MRIFSAQKEEIQRWYERLGGVIRTWIHNPSAAQVQKKAASKYGPSTTQAVPKYGSSAKKNVQSKKKRTKCGSAR